MIKNNLKLLDIDENHRIMFEDLHASRILACKVLGLTLDLATSDVVIYVINKQGESIGLSDYDS